MKKCTRCGKIKENNEFHLIKSSNRPSRTHSVCKTCHSEYEMERYYKKQEFADSKKTPCLKCGEKRIRCITFHHLDPSEKECTIAQFRKSSFDTIEREINKCVCLCLNCHHEFHYLNNKTGISLEEYLSS